jgi:hypothetical protein
MLGRGAPEEFTLKNEHAPNIFEARLIIDKNGIDEALWWGSHASQPTKIFCGSVHRSPGPNGRLIFAARRHLNLYSFGAGIMPRNAAIVRK